MRPDAVKMKRMFVRPETRDERLGQRSFEMRINEARKMECRVKEGWFLVGPMLPGRPPTKSR